MTDKERLEEIKNVRWENLKTSQILHVKWLIERAQELENLNDAFDDLDSDYVDLQEENRSYREALKEIASDDSWETVDEVRSIAYAALESESE